ncbi:MAG: T9SS type A sorting domain-containing protein [Chitinophagaceae bacterium]
MTQLYKNLLRLAFILLCSITTMHHAFATDFTVTNTATSGAGSLANAITLANANSGPDRIIFSIPVSPGVAATIYPTAPLPAITESVEIDGYSQPGASQGTIGDRTILININGVYMSPGDIFTILSSDVTISGLAIYASPGYAISISPSSVARTQSNYNNIFIWGNYIGTDNTGITAGVGNKTGGIASNFLQFAPDVNGNIIIGTNGDDDNDFNEGNLICGSKGDGSGSNGDGILLWNTLSSKISGNYIGLDKNGAGGSSFGNKRFGVLLTVSSDYNVIGTEGDDVSDYNEINYICNNDSNGVVVANSQYNVIAGNNIGVDPSWSSAPNMGNGIHLLGSSNNRIGTNGDNISDYSEMNIIGFNDGYGIVVSVEYFYGFETDATDNIIAGNAIGTSDDGSIDMGNVNAGILLYGNFNGKQVSNNLIGTDYTSDNFSGMTNLIGYNQKGIVVRDPTGGAVMSGNKFALNSIFNNDLLGVDIGDDGITPNSASPAAGRLNAPVITSVTVDETNTHVTINGIAPSNVTMEFYLADAATHPLPIGYTKNFGQGQYFMFRAQDNGTITNKVGIDTYDITDDESGTGSYNGADEGTGSAGTITDNKFSFTVPVSALLAPVTSGVQVTAYAYSATSISEFGGNYSYTVTPVTLNSFTGRLNKGKAYLTWTTSNEVDNKHFEVEKSTDGKHYTKIGTVVGLGGVTNAYNFTDQNAIAPVNYYRLKQVDVDEKFVYSRVVTLRGDQTTAIKTTPNPFTSQINVSYQLTAQETIRINLYDQSGRVVKTYNTVGSEGTNSFNLTDVGYLPAGMYVLEVKGTTTALVRQIFKQK